nr:dual specificity protein kinase TTK-like [Penaeus vannamei]
MNEVGTPMRANAVLESGLPGLLAHHDGEVLEVIPRKLIRRSEHARGRVHIGVKSDVWSLGCILYNLVYGRTPFQHISNPLQKLSAISDPNTKVNFPEIENKMLLEVLQLCLQFDQRKRPSISELLNTRI